LEASLNIYLDKCLDIIGQFTEFQIRHISTHEKYKSNMLAQQASDYDIGGHNFHIKGADATKHRCYWAAETSPAGS
jgi:hypothetical protein